MRPFIFIFTFGRMGWQRIATHWDIKCQQEHRNSRDVFWATTPALAICDREALHRGISSNGWFTNCHETYITYICLDFRVLHYKFHVIRFRYRQNTTSFKMTRDIASASNASLLLESTSKHKPKVIWNECVRNLAEAANALRFVAWPPSTAELVFVNMRDTMR